MTAATGNYYSGLMQFEEMAFLLHFLRPSDLFIDVGANIGSFTILASAVVEAHCIAFEPSPASYDSLRQNCALNNVIERVELYNSAVGSKVGTVRFSANTTSSINRVLATSERDTMACIDVPVVTLDSIMDNREPAMLKVDTEGYETEVIAGARRVLSSPRLNCLIIEAKGHGARYSFDEHELYRTIRGYGFRPCSYDPFTRSVSEMEPYGDCGIIAETEIFCKDIEYVTRQVKEASTFSVLKRTL